MSSQINCPPSFSLNHIITFIFTLQELSNFKSLMGCISHNPSKRVNPIDNISNRSIEVQHQNPALHLSISPKACGYVFSINHQQYAEVLARSKQNEKRQKQADLYEKYQSLLFKLKHQYQTHDIDACMSIISTLEPIQRQLDYTYLDLPQSQLTSTTAYIQSIKDRHSQMIRFTKYIQIDRWTSHGEKEGVKVYTCRDDSTVGVMMESVIDVPVEIFLTVVSQADFYIDLMDNISESREEKYVDRNHRIGYCVYDLPILSIREAIFQALGYDRLHHDGSIFMFSQSIHNLPKRCQQLNYTPPLHEKYVQIDYKYLIIHYIPIGINRGRAFIAVNTDMKLSFVPLSLMEMVSKSICLKFLEAVKDVTHKFKGSKWEAKVKRHPDTFNFFRDIMQQYYKEHDMK